MGMKQAFWILLLAGSVVGVSCNKKSGCPASEASRKMVNVNDDKGGSFGGKKEKKAPKSSVMPAEIRYGGKKGKK